MWDTCMLWVGQSQQGGTECLEASRTTEMGSAGPCTVQPMLCHDLLLVACTTTSKPPETQPVQNCRTSNLQNLEKPGSGLILLSALCPQPSVIAS